MWIILILKNPNNILCVHIFSVNASRCIMYVIWNASNTSKSNLMNQWFFIEITNLNTCARSLKNILDITKIPSSVPFYDSCIPGAPCTTCSQFNGTQSSPPGSSSSHSPLSAVILCFYSTGEVSIQTLVSAFPGMWSWSLILSGASPLPPRKYASVGRKLQHERASLGPCAHGKKGRKGVQISLVELPHLCWGAWTS